MMSVSEWATAWTVGELGRGCRPCQGPAVIMVVGPCCAAEKHMELSRAVGTTDRLWLFRASLMGAADAARAEECVVSIGPAGHGLRHPIPLVMKGRNRTDDAQIWHFAVNGSSPHVTRGLLRLLCGLFPVCLARLHFLVARRQLADWRWPRPFHSTFTTTPRTLAFSHPPTENEGKVKRDMASDASNGLSLSTFQRSREKQPPFTPNFTFP